MAQLLKLLTILCLFIVAIHGYPGKLFQDRKLFDETRDLRLCVTRQVELDKCNDLKQLLLNNKYEYKLECCMNTVDVCVEKVKEGKCDFVILEYQYEMLARNFGLRPYLYEEYSKKSYIVAVADQDITVDSIRTRPIDFDMDDIRSIRAALYFDMIRQDRNICDRLIPFQYDVLNSVNEIPSQNRRMMFSPMDKIRDQTEFVYRNQEEMKNIQNNRNFEPIRFLRFNQLNEYDLSGKVLICPTLELSDLNSYEKCNFDTGSVRTIYGRDLDDDRLYFINYFKQIVKVLNEKRRSQTTSQLKLFGEYRGLKNVLFDDDAVEFSLTRKMGNGLDETQLDKLFCISDKNFQRQMLEMKYSNRDMNMMDSDRYRQYMEEMRNQPRFDMYRYFFMMNPSLTRQTFLLNDRFPQEMRFNDDLLNNQMRELVMQQVPVLDMIRQRILYNVYDPYRQYSGLDRSQRLSDAVRFRQMLNLNPYKQYVLDVTSTFPTSNLDLEQELNRYTDFDRNRMLYDIIRNRQLVEDVQNREMFKDTYPRVMDLKRQQQTLDRDDRFLNEYEMRQYNNRQLLDENQYDTDRYRKFLERDENGNRIPDVYRQMYDVKNDYETLYDNARYRQPLRDDDIVQMQNMNRFQNNNRQIYGRQFLDDDKFLNTQDVDRLNRIGDFRRLGELNSYDQMYDVDRNREVLNNDQMRELPYVKYMMQRLRDATRYRQMYNTDQNRQMLNDQMREMSDVERKPDIDLYRQMYDVRKSYQIPNIDRFRDILEENGYRQTSDIMNDDTYENYLRGYKYLDNDRYKIFRTDINEDRYRKNEDLNTDMFNRKFERSGKGRDEKRSK
ncbi:uncharacterized protein LOC129619064 [Condylostylus longicornis]|uniref:uncharacterized protein LOC129619064 n=1 Tax=Condylostylus longicornis TaxID=2530218 RepID=UPI00244E5101|nr:uncharacterized protein LOC129619064 [Condylostylus longicornis]